MTPNVPMPCHGAGAMTHHTMAGLPDWAFFGALAVVLSISVVNLLRRPGASTEPAKIWRFDVTSIRPVAWALKRRWFQFALQVPLVLTLFVILYAGFFGSKVPERNVATVLTWTIWWTLLIVDIVVLGRMWCLVCPWEALASWIRRLAFWSRRSEEPLALELKWPKWLKNVYPATILFVGLTWLELGYGVTMSPRATATLGLSMVLLAVLPALFFERRAFCRYGCLIGRICGLYSMLAPVELRSRDKDVCSGCKTKDCLNGNDQGYPCPTSQYLRTMSHNTYCTVCTECIKSCPHDNVALNVRAWGADLHQVDKPKKDEATLALVLLSLTSFHGLTMTPTWNALVSDFRAFSGWSWITSFSSGMALILVVPSLLFLLAVFLAARAGQSKSRLRVIQPMGFGRIAATYAYPLIPIALMYHLAHNSGHLLQEATKIVPVLSDPFGRGANYFATAGLSLGPLASMPTIWAIMIGLVVTGHVWATRALNRAHRAVSQRERAPLLMRLSMTVFLFSASAVNLWLLAQPMEMRTGM